MFEFLSAMASKNKLNKKTHWLRSKRINTHDLLLSTLSVFGISVKGRLYNSISSNELNTMKEFICSNVGPLDAFMLIDIIKHWCQKPAFDWL